MTNPIGSGTCNVSINLPVDERAELGRLAFQSGSKSVGDFLRSLLLTGLEHKDAAAAQRIREIRRIYYSASLLGLFLSTLAFGDHIDLRRSRSGLRVRVEEVREGEA